MQRKHFLSALIFISLGCCGLISARKDESKEETRSVFDKIKGSIRESWDYIAQKVRRDNADIEVKLDRIEKSAEQDAENVGEKRYGLYYY